MIKVIKTFKIAASAVAVAAAMASTAHAAGFQLTEQSALGLGRSYAGIGVDGTDLSGVYFNPASMTLHKGTAIQAGLVGIGMNLDYADHAGDQYDQNGRAGRGYIPHGYIVHQINDKTWFGLAMTVPFGMSTEFDKNWIHADHGTDSEILSVDINPNFAFKLSEKISFGAGVSFQYVDASLGMGSNMAEVSEGNYAYVPGALRSEIEADNYAWGWNVGVMFTPVENVRIGLSYRSSIEHNARGTVSISSSIPEVSGVFGGSYSSLTTVEAPAWAMLSAAWDVNKDISLYATLRWADWSSFETVTTHAQGLEQIVGGILARDPDNVVANGIKQMSNIPNYWKDTYLMSIGGDWRVSDFWTLRGGIGYETSPIDQKEYRTAIIPDADRLWLSVGSTFHWSKNFQTDVAFTHLRGVHERSLYNDKGEDFGKFRKLDAWLVGVQAQYRF